MKIILIGLRGAGKSTVGEILAARLGLSFLDTDVLVERVCGKTVAEIFREQGEFAFREFETTALRGIGKRREDSVVATGGGIVLRPENQVLLPKMGKVVYLFAKPELVRERFARDPAAQKRPSLEGKPLEEEIEFLFLTRDPIYRDIADLVLPVKGKTPEEICGSLEAKLPRIKKRLPKDRLGE